MIELLKFYKIAFYVLSGVIGLCVGSFLNVVIYRVPNKMSVAFPASHCPDCKSPIKWYDNIPVISYLILGGKCRNCKKHISFRYTAVEILNTVLWLLAAFMFYETSVIYAVVLMAASSVLICIFFIDLENMIIPDRFQIILLCLAVIGFFFDKSELSGINHFIYNILGGVFGFAVMWLLGFIGEKVSGREALGGGDIKLCGVMGLFLGWQKFLLSVLIASVSASIVILVYKSKGEGKDREYPFAPFLSTGFLIGLFFGNPIINAYISLLTA